MNCNWIRILVCFLFAEIQIVVSGQEKCFLTTFVEDSCSWLVTDALETMHGDFLVCAYDRSGKGSALLKMSSDGEITTKIDIVATDTTLHANTLMPVSNEYDEDYLLLCTGYPVGGDMVALLFIRYDKDLHTMQKKTIPLPFIDEENQFWDAKYLLSDTSIFAALTTRQYGSAGSVFITKFDFDGNLLECQRWGRDSISTVCNLFRSGNDRISLFGRLNPSHMGLMTFDQSLRLIDRDTILQWTAPVGENGDYFHYSITDLINSQAIMLPDGSHVVSARLYETMCHPSGNLIKDDRSAVIAKYGNGFHQPDDILVIESMNDSLEYPAFFRSVDVRVVDEARCEVIQCSILNEFPQFGILQPYPTGIVVTKTDQNLNVVWKKRFLRDGNYQAMTINFTSDGGCLVVGSVGEYQAQKLGVFAFKTNADGTVGLEELHEESLASVYPNPTGETIRIGGMEAKETRIYNTIGQCVKTFLGNETSVADLPAGLYLLRAVAFDGKSLTARIVVAK